MRRVVIMPHAERSLLAVAEFINSKNSPGNGDRWANELIDFIYAYAQLKIVHPLCKNEMLAQRGFSCVVFNKK